jgi:hypothetical protein
MIRITITLYFLCFCSFVSADSFNFDEVDQKIRGLYAYAVDERSREERLKLLVQYESTINQGIQDSPNNPQLYYLLGRSIFIQRFIHENLYRTNRELWADINNRTVESYDRALELDEDNEPHLTLSMLKVIGFLGFDELTVKSLSKVVDVMKQDDEIARQYDDIDTIGMLIRNLIEIGEYERVEELQSYLESKYTHSNAVNAFKKHRKHYQKQIEEREAKLAMQERMAKAKEEPKEEPKPALVAEVKPEPQAQQPEPKPAPVVNPEPVKTPALKPQGNPFWYMLAAIIAVLVIGGVLLKRRS